MIEDKKLRNSSENYDNLDQRNMSKLLVSTDLKEARQRKNTLWEDKSNAVMETIEEDVYSQHMDEMIDSRRVSESSRKP